MTYLFSVEDRFAIEGRGVVLAPGIPRDLNLPGIRDGARIQLRKPDLTVVDTFIRSIEMIRYRPEVPPEKRTIPILLPKRFHKFDVPIGTEVFLHDESNEEAEQVVHGNTH
jgi:hypothetical protein